MVPSKTPSAPLFNSIIKPSDATEGTKEPQPEASLVIGSVVLHGFGQAQILLEVELWLVQGRELQLTDCQDKDGKDTNHLPEAQPPDHHRLRSDRIRFLFWGFCGGLRKKDGEEEKKETWFRICKDHCRAARMGKRAGTTGVSPGLL